MNVLLDLSASDLRLLADALRIGRLAMPYTALAVRRFCPNGDSEAIAGAIRALADEGATPGAISMTLTLLADGKAPAQATANIVDLVWTGPEAPDAPSRDTGVVVRELFTAACEHVLVAGYAVYQGKEVFRVLSERMEACPELKVEMFLDIQRPHADTTITGDLLRRFAQRFKAHEWPGQRLPDIYYDPRALEMDRSRKAALHAKCVIVDHSIAFVSSANFTEAAQNRNIEVGALIKSPSYAGRLTHHFHALVKAGCLNSLDAYMRTPDSYS